MGEELHGQSEISTVVHSGTDPSSFSFVTASSSCHAIFHPIFYSILHSCVRSVKKVQWILYARDSSWAPTRGVMIPRLESIPEDFHHFSEIYDSNSNSCKKRFLYCTGIDSGYWNRFQNSISIMDMISVPIQIPEKNRNHNNSSSNSLYVHYAAYTTVRELHAESTKIVL